MVDSNFWSDMACAFAAQRERAIQKSRRPLDASFHPGGWGLEAVPAFSDTTSGRWMLNRDTDQSAEEFKSIASVCAVALGCCNTDGAWVEWLDYLRRESRDFKAAEFTISARSDEKRPDPDVEIVAKGLAFHVVEIRPDPEVETVLEDLGEIDDVCAASERFCRRLADEHLKTELQRTGDAPDKVVANARKAVLEPILTQRGWSTLDWAQNAKVDYNTASDYLNGTTNPRRDTIKKLADALGMSPNDMPA